jgi:hypothetical protein
LVVAAQMNPIPGANTWVAVNGRHAPRRIWPRIDSQAVRASGVPAWIECCNHLRAGAGRSAVRVGSKTSSGAGSELSADHSSRIRRAERGGSGMLTVRVLWDCAASTPHDEQGGFELAALMNLVGTSVASMLASLVGAVTSSTASGNGRCRDHSLPIAFDGLGVHATRGHRILQRGKRFVDLHSISFPLGSRPLLSLDGGISAGLLDGAAHYRPVG